MTVPSAPTPPASSAPGGERVAIARRVLGLPPDATATPDVARPGWISLSLPVLEISHEQAVVHWRLCRISLLVAGLSVPNPGSQSPDVTRRDDGVDDGYDLHLSVLVEPAAGDFPRREAAS